MKKRIIALVLTLSILLSAVFVSGAYFVAADDSNEEPLPLYTGNFQGGGFENDDDLSKWTVSGKTDQTVSIDIQVNTGHLAVKAVSLRYGYQQAVTNCRLFSKWLKTILKISSIRKSN